MKKIQGPAIFLAQFAGDEAPFNSLNSIARWAAGLVQSAPAQGPLGPADPLRHRRLRHVEGVGDLPVGEAADGAKGQRYLRGGR